MKRSEMIKHVLESVCGSYELSEDSVDEVLKVIEDAGMLPPPLFNSEVVKNVMEANEYAKPSNYGWEPEND